MHRVLIVCSSGGHLDQALLHLPVFDGWEIQFATFGKRDVIDRLDGFKVHKVYFPTNRNLKNLLRNTVLAIKILRQFEPNLIFSTGAAVAVPFFFVGRLLRIETMYLECFDRVRFPTLTSKLVKYLTSYFICQDENQMEKWPNRFIFGPSR